jgi:hypothetical protein
MRNRKAMNRKAREEDARCRSRSPTLSRKDKQPMEDIDDFIGKRVAQYFGNTVYFGSVVERIRGAVFAKQPDTGLGVLQVVWRIVYDDADVEQMSRNEIIATMHTHKLLEKIDHVGGSTQIDLPILAENNEEELDDENGNQGFFCNATHFLDMKYRPLDMLTPNEKQTDSAI